MEEKDLNRELTELYGSAWFYASYYLLMKSESRETDEKTNYFYKNGDEASELYDMIGWDFFKKDIARKSRYKRERARCIECGDRKGYEEVTLSEKRYDEEKQLVLKASQLGRFLGPDEFKRKIGGFILSEERTDWFSKNRELAAHRDAVARVLAKKFHTTHYDILLLEEIKDSKGVFLTLSFGKDTQPEPARFLGIETIDGKEVYLLEHLREIGTAWSGTYSTLKNIKESAMHDGCLEVVMVPSEVAEEFFIALNAENSFMQGRLETRCMIADAGRKLRDKILRNEPSSYKGKPMVSLDELCARYHARNERYFPGLSEREFLAVKEEEQRVVKEQELLANEIRSYGEDGISRLDTMLNMEIKRQREEVMARYRQFYKARAEQGESGRTRNPYARSRDVNLAMDKESARNRRQKEL